MEIQNTLLEYDDENLKDFDEFQLNCVLNKRCKKNQQELTSEELAELMAFGFCEDYKDNKTGWGTYFGPMIVMPNENGKMSETPSIQLVTDEMLRYWTGRARKVSNPILKARYSGLVWDLTKYITKNNPSFEIAKINILAIIRIANEEYYNSPLQVYSKLKKALLIAIQLKDELLIKECKDTIINFEDRVSQDNLAGLWGYAFELLVFNKKVSLANEEVNSIINNLRSRLDRLLTSHKDEKQLNIGAAKHATIMLADYYRKTSNNIEVKQIIQKFATAVELSWSDKSPIIVASNAEELYNLFTKYHMKEEAATMLLKLRELSSKVPSEMKTISAEISISKEKIQEFLDQITKGGLNDSINKYILAFIPFKQAAIEQLKLREKMHPISYLFKKDIVDNKGRVLTTIGPISEDFAGHLVNEICLLLNVQSISLQLVISEFIKKYGFNSSDVLGRLKNCPIIEKERFGIIERGLDAYFSQDYITAVHLIIPQFEEAIRNIVENGGGNVLKEARGGGYHLRTFDDILRDDLVIQCLGEDISDYFKILFTDQRGWNLRNNVCHGLTEHKLFNYQTADRVVHALLCLSLISINDD